MKNLLDRIADSLKKTWQPELWLTERLTACGVDAAEAADVARAWHIRVGGPDARDRIVQFALKGHAEPYEVAVLAENLPGIFTQHGQLTFRQFVEMVRAAAA